MRVKCFASVEMLLAHPRLHVSLSYTVILDGYYNYANQDTYVDIVGGFETLADRYSIEEIVDICDLDAYSYAADDDGNNNEGDDGNAAAGDDQYNDDANAAAGDDQYNDDAYAANGDDQYNDDAYAYARNDDYYNNRMLDENGECPADGLYEFSVQVPLINGKWSATGWGASTDLQMYAHDGSVLASCQLNFKTKTTSGYIIPASVIMITSVIAVGAMLFYVVFYLIRRELLCTNPCGASRKDIKRHRNEEKDYTRWEEDLKDEEPGLAEIARESGRGLSGPNLMRKPSPAKKISLRKSASTSDESDEGLLS